MPEEPKTIWKRLPFDLNGDPGPPEDLPEELAKARRPDRAQVQRFIDARCEYYTALLQGRRLSGEALGLVAIIISEEIGASVVIQLTPPWEGDGQRLIGYEAPEPTTRRVQGHNAVVARQVPTTVPVISPDGYPTLNPENLTLLRRAAAATTEAVARLPGGTQDEWETLAMEIARQTCAACHGAGNSCLRCQGLGIDVSIGRNLDSDYR